MSTDRKKEIIRSLRTDDDRRHSYTLADIATNEAMARPLVKVMNDQDNQICNHATLRAAGWDGKHCIGAIDCSEAIMRLQTKQPLACDRVIPIARRRQVPKAYRDVDCQSIHDAKGTPRTKRR